MAISFYFHLKRKDVYDKSLNKDVDTKTKLQYEDDIEFLKNFYE